MTREDVIRLALEAGLFDDDQEPLPEYLEHFANLVIEECAKEADKWSKRNDDVGYFIAAAIRARKSK